MKKNVENLPDWLFDLDEVSAGVYKLKAEHISGCNIELSGFDPDELMAQAQKDARKMQADIERRSKQV